MEARSPFAPRSTNEELPAGTPKFYKFLDETQMDEVEESEESVPQSPMPPPPPPMEEHAAPEAKDAPSASSSSSSSWSARRAVGAYALGHSVFAYLCFSATPVLSMASWFLLVALITNGMKMSITGRCTAIPLPSAEQSAKVAEALSQAVNLLNRFKTAEPKLTFMTACGAWALVVISSMVSPLALMWAAYTVAMRGAVLSPEATAKLDSTWQMARTKVESLATDARLASARSAIAPHSAQLERLYGTVADVLSAHSEQIKFVTPMAGFMGWLFLLGWVNKFLIGGMTLLAYKAWASPEAAAQLDAKIGKAARASRRMTLSAADRMGLMKPKVA